MEFYKIKKENNNTYSCGGQKIISETIILADPTYDLTFRGEIEDIKVLNNENIQKDINKTKIGVYSSLLRSSLVLEVEKKNDIYNTIGLLNIEMQWGYPYNFIEKLVNYGLLLKNNNKKIKKYIQPEKDKTLVLVFINPIDNVDFESKSYFLAEFNSENNQFIKKVDDFIDIIIINLQEISQKLENDEKIYILGKEVGTTGKNWLKLLSLSYWGIEADKNYFKIPNCNFNEEMNTAINYLRSVESNYKDAKTDYLDSIIKTEKEKEAEREAKREYWDSVMAAAEEKVAYKLKIYPILKEFIKLYKINPNVDLEKAEKTLNIDFSEIDIDDVMRFWGNKDDNKEKLEYLKNFLAKRGEA